MLMTLVLLTGTALLASALAAWRHAKGGGR